MKTPHFVSPIMKPQSVATLFLGIVLFVATLPATVTAADLSQLIADTAKWESGQSQEPLRKFEQLARESAGRKKERAELEAAFVKLLAPASTFEARRFACQQLAVIGSDSSTPAIAKLLADEKTTGIACLAFGNRSSAKADQALRAALPTANGQGRLQIISTLGNRRDAKAVKSLTALTRDADAAVAETAVRALGMIASQPACKVIATLCKEAHPPFTPSLADASLRCAAALASRGDRKAATAICETLVAPAQLAFVRRGAIRALLALDADGGEQRTLQTLRGSDLILKPVAIAAVSLLRDSNASEVFAQELSKLSVTDQVWLIDALAARADASARAAIMGQLNSSSATVRLAAASALGRIGGATAVRPLAKALAAAQAEDEIRTLQAALGGLPNDRDTDKAIIAEIKSTREETRARLIATLATRRDPKTIATLFEEAESNEAVVAIAAYRVLARAGTGENLPRLLKQFASLPNAELRSDVAGFVQQAVVATEEVSLRSKAVCDALDQTTLPTTRCALLELLPSVGDARALKALLAAVNGTDGQQRDAAVHALSEWPDIAAWDALYAIYRQPLNEAYRSITLRSLVRLAGEANSKPDDKLMARYRDLLVGARDAADLKQILGALGGAANPEALKLARALVDRAGVQAEADVAVKKITAALKAKSK